MMLPRVVHSGVHCHRYLPQRTPPLCGHAGPCLSAAHAAPARWPSTDESRPATHRGAGLRCSAAAPQPPPATEGVVRSKSERSQARRRRRQGRSEPPQEDGGADPLADRAAGEILFAEQLGYLAAAPEVEQVRSSAGARSSAAGAASELQQHAGRGSGGDTASNDDDPGNVDTFVDRSGSFGADDISGSHVEMEGGMQQLSAAGSDASFSGEHVEDAGVQVVDPDVVLSDEAQAVRTCWWPASRTSLPPD